MTREERKELVSHLKYSLEIGNNPCLMVEDIEEIIKALEQEPCEDCISRQAVLDMATTIQTDDFSGNEIIEVVEVDDIKALPPVTPKPKTGYWIKKDYWKPLPFDEGPLDWDNYDEKTHSEKVSHWYCSECDADKGEHRPVVRFCEDCGAKMVEPQESEEKK